MAIIQGDADNIHAACTFLDKAAVTAPQHRKGSQKRAAERGHKISPEITVTHVVSDEGQAVDEGVVYDCHLPRARHNHGRSAMVEKSVSLNPGTPTHFQLRM